jgi:hypothetical protein
VKTHRKVTRHETVRVTGVIPNNILQDAIDSLVPEAPPHAIATITVRVPGGGDWSNTTLEDPDIEFSVEWSTEETEEDVGA